MDRKVWHLIKDTKNLKPSRMDKVFQERTALKKDKEVVLELQEVHHQYLNLHSLRNIR